MPEIPEALLTARVAFWQCIIPEHAHPAERRVTVEWVDGVAHCTTPGCELTSAHTQQFMKDLLRYRLDMRPWERADGDSRCQECGSANIVWFTNSDLWNKVCPDDGILCIVCFVAKAEEVGIDQEAWYVAPQSRVVAP